MNIKQILSYLTPIKHKVYRSDVSEQIEVTWASGKLVIDSKRANYSYGNLQKILHKGLKIIGFDRIKLMQNILILGLGGGSVAKTLVNEIGCTGNIVGVELDPVMIGIGKKYFALDQLNNLQIVQSDALSYVQTNQQHYDLIIVDIFQDVHMPDFVFSEKFIQNIKNKLNTNSYLLINTIVTTQEIAKKIDHLTEKLNATGFNAKQYKQVLGEHNNLIIIKKN